jgi:hypothetical protein
MPFADIDAQSPIQGKVVMYKDKEKPKHNEGLGRKPQRLGVCIMLTIVHTVPRFQVCSDSPAANG